MILKKPYAFLIKHFKIIHLLLCIPLVYLIIRTGMITSFLRTYVSANYYTSEVNIAGSYINLFMYFAIIVILVLAFSIYFLMKQKEKDTKYYIFLIAYYLFLLIIITIAHGILSSIETTSLSAQTIRLYRDLAYVCYIPEFFFTIYTLLRGIGFDIKKFDFGTDVKELEITDVDSEEFELTFGKDSYKYKRKIRRFIREFKYYVLENKVTFTILSSICVIILGVLVYLNFGVYHKTYREKQKISHNGLIVTVEDSILTNLDSGGKNIDGKYYLATSFKVVNNTSKKLSLDYENFKLEVSKRILSPTLDRSSYFPTLGSAYTRDTVIMPNSTNTFVIPYEIDKSFLNQKISLKILDSLTYEIGSVTPIYKTVNLKYDKIFTNKDVKTIPKGKILELSSTPLAMTQIEIKNALLTNSYEYNYRSCTKNDCQDLKNKVISSSNKKLLVIEKNFSLDTYTTYSTSRKGDSSFTSDFLSLKVGNNIISMNDITPKELDGYWIFEVPSTISDLKSITILVTVCGSRYTMNLT